MKSLILICLLVFSVESFACGAKFEVQTELEINGKITRPKIVTVAGETTKVESTEGGVKTTLQLVAQEVWDEQHQGDAVKLVFKVYQSEGRRTLVESTPTIIARLGEPVETTVTEEKPGAKPVRLKVTAKKI